MMDKPYDIAIIGAGFSGCALAVQLLRNFGDRPLRIAMLNRHATLARGVAYGTHSPSHLLNVPAGRMSLFPDNSDDFLNYARQIDPEITSGSFVWRSLYGSYLETRLKEAVAAAPKAEFRQITGEAVGMTPPAGGGITHITSADGSAIECKMVVLATGNYAPANPSVPEPVFFESRAYIRDPWASNALEDIADHKPVLLIGTGLTMVDVALELDRRGFANRLLAISRRGLLPQPHRDHVPTPFDPSRLLAELSAGEGRILRYLQIVRRYSKNSRGDWRDIVGALRPVTATLWRRLDSAQKRRFLRHLQPYWDTHRHRMAPAIAEGLSRLVTSGKLLTGAGRLLRFESLNTESVRVSWRPRGSIETKMLEVTSVINCTGPDSNVARFQDPLFTTLRRQGFITADELGLGVRADLSGALLDRNGHPATWLYYTGPLLKARDWECTAVPELRSEAQRLAVLLAAKSA